MWECLKVYQMFLFQPHASLIVDTRLVVLVLTLEDEHLMGAG